MKCTILVFFAILNFAFKKRAVPGKIERVVTLPVALLSENKLYTSRLVVSSFIFLIPLNNKTTYYSLKIATALVSQGSSGLFDRFSIRADFG